MDFRKENFDTKFVTTLMFKDGTSYPLHKSIDILLDYKVGSELLLRMPKGYNLKSGVYRVSEILPDLLEGSSNKECEGTLVRTYILNWNREKI